MEGFVLMRPTEKYLDEARAYRAAFLAAGDSMDGTGSLRQTEDPAEWLDRCIKYEDRAQTPAHLVPATQLIYVRESDQKVVGMLQVRHYLNLHLQKYGGHIGYSVHPDERRKGYATEMLKAALDFCREMGMKNVMVSCNDDNEASRRTILKNGGVYTMTAVTEDGKENIEHYWITLY